MIDFIDEVKQDLRKERYGKIVNKYGSIFLVLVAVAVGATAFISWRLNVEEGEKLAQGKQFFEAMQLEEIAESSPPAALPTISVNPDAIAIPPERQKKLEEAANAFATIASSSGGGFEQLSRLREAALLAQLGNPQKAIEAYEAIKNDTAVDPAIRDLANLQAVTLMVEHGDEVKPDSEALTKRLENLSEDKRVWKYSALEMQAFKELKAGNEAKALELFEALQLDANVPENMFERVMKMVSLLRSKQTEYDPFIAEASVDVSEQKKEEADVKAQ